MSGHYDPLRAGFKLMGISLAGGIAIREHWLPMPELAPPLGVVFLIGLSFARCSRWLR